MGKSGVLSLRESVWVDVHEFERLASALPNDSPELRAAKLEQTLALFVGDFLPNDLYSDWTQAPRDALRRLYRETTLALATHYRDAHDYVRAIALLTQLITRDLVDELAHRELMRIYALAEADERAERIDKPDEAARTFEMLALACHSLGEWQTGIYYE